MERKDAIKVLKDFWSVYEVGTDIREAFETLIPELKESEDERIRNFLIGKFREIGEVWHEYSTKDIIAWLEKQGEHIKFLESIQIGDEVTRNPDGVLVNLSQLKRVAKRGSQKLANSEKTCKVKPKFKVGDWVVYCGKTCKITGLNNGIFTITNPDGSYFFNQVKSTIEPSFHLWTIQDAKDGDMLAHSSSMLDDFIFIYNSTSILQAYCYYSNEKNRLIIEDRGHHCPWNMQEVTPATKEQRDLLFQKMKESGYEWDAEKKELRKH